MLGASTSAGEAEEGEESYQGGESDAETDA